MTTQNVFPRKTDDADELTVALTPVDLSRRYSLRIRLLDFTGRPAPAAQLRLMVSSQRPVVRQDNKFNWVLIKSGQLAQKPYCDQFLSGVSDGAGEFEFEDILPGKHLRLAYWGEGVPQGLSLDFAQARAGESDLAVIKLPQPAYIVGTIKREGFPDAGSIRLMLLDEDFHDYELKLNEDDTRFEFDDLPPGNYQVWVGSKPVESSENGQTGYTITGLASQRIQLKPGETKEVPFNEPDADKKAPAKPAPAPVAKPAAAARSLDIIVAEHIILWDGRIRTWDEVVAELRQIRKAEGKPIHPQFRFTHGAFAAGHFETYSLRHGMRSLTTYDRVGEKPCGCTVRSGDVDQDLLTHARTRDIGSDLDNYRLADNGIQCVILHDDGRPRLAAFGTDERHINKHHIATFHR